MSNIPDHLLYTEEHEYVLKSDDPIVVTIGIMIGWVFAVVVGSPTFNEVPLWLPPLPFAVVAVTLFAFRILAWVWGDEDERIAAGQKAPDQHH